MSRRARARENARPWTKPTPESPIDWSALAADLARREQQAQQPQKGQQQ